MNAPKHPGRAEWRSAVPRIPSSPLEVTLIVLLLIAVAYYGAQVIDMIRADALARAIWGQP